MNAAFSKMEKFTRSAQSTLRLAQSEAVLAGHALIEPEHLLLALAQPESGSASEILRSLQVDEKKLRDALKERFLAEAQPDRPLELSQHTRDFLALSVLIASEVGHYYLGTEHFLVALMRQSRPGVMALLDASGTSVAAVLGAAPAIFSRKTRLSTFDAWAAGFSQAVDLAVAEAEEAKRTHVEPEHLLLGLWQIEYPPLLHLFAAHEIDETRLQNAVEQRHGQRKQNKSGEAPERSHDVDILIRMARSQAHDAARPVLPYDLFYLLMGEYYPLHRLFALLKLNRVQFRHDLAKYGIYWRQPNSILERVSGFPAAFVRPLMQPLRAFESWRHPKE